ncbi:MAG: Stp1/IreP family PP2C-type Ser/Thr phosphatase [Clostridiales bacterium]|nr:Stp1/IreP family PP2C-type Ser/Thr phosphatase [Clostridiales bacterium]
MKYWGLTDKGTVRTMNQDSFFAGSVGTLDGKETVLCLVCDGMGGAKAGDLASATAREKFVEAIKNDIAAGNGNFRVIMADAADRANRDILELAKSSPDYRGMGTTLVAALLCGDRTTVVNVGDSRCYIIKNNEIKQVTKDHSLVEDMIDKGELSREQAWKHPRKNLITRAVGTELHVHCDTFEVELDEGDYLLLCSDGLSNIVNSQEMLFEVLYGDSNDTAAERMMNIALGRNASDNVTVVLLSK